MSRPLRIEYPHAVYHVTSRGNARQKIFLNDEDRFLFLSIFGQVVERFQWLCHSYCLMDNHYHLLIETPLPNLSKGMRQLNGVYTQTFNRSHGKVGHIFQGRYKAIIVEKEAHLLELCRYVVLNPVRAKMVEHPKKWWWSSYGALSGKVKFPEFLTVDWVLGHFGKRQSLAQREYSKYVEEGLGEESPWDKLQGQIYLGRKEFIEKFQPDQIIEEIPRRQTQAVRPDLNSLFSGKKNFNKKILEAYREYGYPLKHIATHLGVHYSTVSRHIKKAEKSKNA